MVHLWNDFVLIIRGPAGTRAATALCPTPCGARGIMARTATLGNSSNAMEPRAAAALSCDRRRRDARVVNLSPQPMKNRLLWRQKRRQPRAPRCRFGLFGSPFVSPFGRCECCCVPAAADRRNKLAVSRCGWHDAAAAKQASTV